MRFLFALFRHCPLSVVVGWLKVIINRVCEAEGEGKSHSYLVYRPFVIPSPLSSPRLLPRQLPECQCARTGMCAVEEFHQVPPPPSLSFYLHLFLFYVSYLLNFRTPPFSLSLSSSWSSSLPLPLFLSRSIHGMSKVVYKALVNTVLRPLQ